jgi:hypothetical protein
MNNTGFLTCSTPRLPALLLLLASPGVARAQEVVTQTTTTTTTVTRREYIWKDDPIHYRQGRLRLRLGAFLPFRPDVRMATNNTHLAGGGSLDLFRANVRRQPFTVEFYTDATDRSETGNRLTNVGGGLALRFYTAPPTAENRGYFGLGGGAYRVRYATPGSGFDSRIKAGGKAFFGVDAPGGMFVEFNYTALEKERGYDTGGAMLQVGFRL